MIRPRRKAPAHFVVRMVLPRGATKAAARLYIAEAVRAWSGGFHPSDPLFDLDRDAVSVSHHKPGLGKL